MISLSGLDAWIFVAGVFLLGVAAGAALIMARVREEWRRAKNEWEGAAKRGQELLAQSTALVEMQSQQHEAVTIAYSRGARDMKKAIENHEAIIVAQIH